MIYQGWQISNVLTVILQFQNWVMNSIDRTPSVQFNFEDTAKRTQLSQDALFQLSCTHQKNSLHQNISLVKPLPIYLNHQIAQSKQSFKVKTQQFFEEFDQNFIVTFEEDNKINSQISTNAEIQHRESTDPDNETISKITLSHNRSNQETKEDPISQFSIQEPTLILHQKEKSPIPAFSVKKRTVFKSKQNIQWRNQQFKLTKKKIFNKDTLEIVAAQSKTCKIVEKTIKADLKLFLTQRVGKFGELQQLMGGGKRKYKSTIFQREEPKRRRPSTLQNRKQIFQKLKQGLMQRTVKRQSNIFKKPFSQQ